MSKRSKKENEARLTLHIICTIIALQGGEHDRYQYDFSHGFRGEVTNERDLQSAGHDHFHCL